VSWRATSGRCLAIDREWRPELPDGREVVVQRHGGQWIVHCGSSHAISDNLDVALAEVVHAETLSPHLPHEVHYLPWIRRVADELTSDN
jgi:hypothetical protein